MEDKTPEPVLIKKYPNRRLYNTHSSAYIVLDDIVELIKSETPFAIEDAKTGEDLTRSILNQIIYDREANHTNHHFPLDVQKQLILMYDDAYGKMIPEYMRESMRIFISERNRMKDAFEEMVNINSQTMARFGENLAKQNLEVFNKTFEFFQNVSGLSSKTSGTKLAGDVAERDTQLEQIQSQIDELQKQLQSLKK